MSYKKQPIKTISLFSGIGAYEKAASNLGIELDVLHFCEINKFAATAYSAIHDVPEEKNLGDISLVDTSKLPKCDLVTYSFPCFVGGTLVLTSNGYKKIEDIQVGDEVLTHTNTFKEVVLPMEKYAKEIYRVSSMSSEDLLVTEEHPFYVREKLNKEFSKPEWVKVKDLTKKHYLGIAINKEETLPDLNNYGFSSKQLEIFNKYITSKSFWWLIGRYLTNFHLDYREDITICCFKEELETIKSKLDDLKLEYKITEDKMFYNIHIYFKAISLFVKQFGLYGGNRRLTDTIFNLPKEYLKSFLEGYMSLNLPFKDDFVYTLSRNKELIYGLGQCIAKAYNRPYFVSVISGIINGQSSEVYMLKFSKEKQNIDIAFYEEGYVWFPIDSISKEEYDGMVYNMEVKEDNSYTVNNVIVHNCQSISCAGRREGIIKGETKSGLVYEALDVIEATSPNVAIMENVKNLVGKQFINDFNNLLEILDELGYNNYWKVLNAKQYGLPQNRERVFLVSIKKELDTGYTFPEPVELKLKAIDLINKEDENVYWVNEESDAKVYEWLLSKNPNKIEGVAKNPRTREYHGFKEISDCLLAHDAQTKNLVQFVNKDGETVYRRMTPAESFKFMGFEEKDYLKAKKKLEEKHYNGKPRSDSQTYRMAGNSIAVNCIQAILENIYLK